MQAKRPKGRAAVAVLDAIDDLMLYTDIIQACAKGLEIPYIYGRLDTGMNIEATRPIVTKILRRALGMEALQMAPAFLKT